METQIKQIYDAFGDELILKVQDGQKTVLQKNKATIDDALAMLESLGMKHKVDIYCPITGNAVIIQINGKHRPEKLLDKIKQSELLVKQMEQFAKRKIMQFWAE